MLNGKQKKDKKIKKKKKKTASLIIPGVVTIAAITSLMLLRQRARNKSNPKLFYREEKANVPTGGSKKTISSIPPVPPLQFDPWATIGTWAKENNFIVQNVLSGGQFGTVFQCCHIKTKKIVAVKVSKISFQEEYETCKEFEKFKVGFPCKQWIKVSDNEFLLVMEKIDGTLEELFEKFNEIKDINKTLEIISQKLVHLVELLCKHNLAHSDPHFNNIAYKSKRNKLFPNNITPENLDIRFIDFGKAGHSVLRKDECKYVILFHFEGMIRYWKFDDLSPKETKFRKLWINLITSAFFKKFTKFKRDMFRDLYGYHELSNVEFLSDEYNQFKDEEDARRERERLKKSLLAKEEQKRFRIEEAAR